MSKLTAYLRQIKGNFTTPRRQHLELPVYEQVNRQLFETAQVGILILDSAKGEIIDVNPFFVKMMGYSRTELLGKKIWQLEIFQNTLNSKYSFIKLRNQAFTWFRDLFAKTKDGHQMDVEFVSNVYLIDDHRVIQCNFRDITECKKIEESLRARTDQLEELIESQEMTKQAMLNVMEDLEEAKAVIEFEKVKDEAMLESIGEGLVAVDNKANVIVMNKVAEDILGYKFSELAGKKLTDLILEDEMGHLINLEHRPTTIALKTGKSTKVVFYYVRKDKTRFPIAVTATPIRLKNKVIGLIEIVRDITEELAIDKAKSEFVSLASHQLRTPLGIVKWYLEALEGDEYYIKSPNIFKKFVNEIHKNNERVLSLVRDLLSVSRIEQGKIKNAPTAVDIRHMLGDIVEQMKIEAGEKKISLRLKICNPKIPVINIDELRLHEVIENIICNAIGYSKDEGQVNILVDVKQDILIINVKDHGIGISTEDQQKIFTKFFRSEKAIGHNPSGTGLGLYIARSYIRGWGGDITVKSIEDIGSTFTITLPISKK